MKPERILAIDVGASKLEFGVWQAGRFKVMGRQELEKSTDAACLLQVIGELAKLHQPRAIGLALPGFVVRGKILHLPNLAKVNVNTFASGLHRLGIPVDIENDVKCMALAEWKERRCRKDDDFILIAPGSGIGGAIVRNGKLVRGKGGMAGEFGHMPMRDEKGKMSEYETLAAGLGIEKKYGKAGWDAKRILHSREPKAWQLSEQAAISFGTGLALLANALDPGVILVCGSAGRGYMRSPHLRKLVLQTYTQCLILPLKKTPLRCAASAYPALRGAAMMAQKNRDKKVAKFLGAHG